MVEILPVGQESGTVKVPDFNPDHFINVDDVVSLRDSIIYNINQIDGIQTQVIANKDNITLLGTRLTAVNENKLNKSGHEDINSYVHVNSTGDINFIAQNKLLHKEEDSTYSNKSVEWDVDGVAHPTKFVHVEQGGTNVNNTLVVNGDGNLALEEYKLSKLKDVSVTDVATGNVLSWNGSNWIPMDITDFVNNAITAALTTVLDRITVLEGKAADADTNITALDTRLTLVDDATTGFVKTAGDTITAHTSEIANLDSRVTALGG